MSPAVDRQLEQLDPRRLRLALNGGLLLLAAALFAYLLWPQICHYQAQNRSLVILRQASTNQAELAGQLAKLQEEAGRLRHRLQGDLGDLPPEQVETHVINLLQRMCWEHRLELASVSPLPGEKIHVFRETVFDVEVHGDYPDFYNWLWAVQEKLGFLVVKRFEIVPLRVDQALSRLAVKIQIVAYRLSES